MGHLVYDRDNHISSLLPYLLLLYIGLGFCLIGGLTLLSYGKIGVIFLVVGLIGIGVASSYLLVIFYQVWRFVINGLIHENLTPSIDTPGKAVGYTFIPIYSIYWMFRFYGKLPVDINALATRNNIMGTAPEGMGMSIPALTIIGIIPYVGYITEFISVFVLMPIFISKLIKLCRLIDYKSQFQQAPTTETPSL